MTSIWTKYLTSSKTQQYTYMYNADIQWRRPVYRYRYVITCRCVSGLLVSILHTKHHQCYLYPLRSTRRSSLRRSSVSLLILSLARLHQQFPQPGHLHGVQRGVSTSVPPSVDVISRCVSARSWSSWSTTSPSYCQTFSRWRCLTVHRQRIDWNYACLQRQVPARMQLQQFARYSSNGTIYREAQ